MSKEVEFRPYVRHEKTGDHWVQGFRWSGGGPSIIFSTDERIVVDCALNLLDDDPRTEFDGEARLVELCAPSALFCEIFSQYITRQRYHELRSNVFYRLRREVETRIVGIERSRILECASGKIIDDPEQIEGIDSHEFCTECFDGIKFLSAAGEVITPDIYRAKHPEILGDYLRRLQTQGIKPAPREPSVDDYDDSVLVFYGSGIVKSGSIRDAKVVQDVSMHYQADIHFFGRVKDTKKIEEIHIAAAMEKERLQKVVKGYEDIEKRNKERLREAEREAMRKALE